jgi:hypothetical protein
VLALAARGFREIDEFECQVSCQTSAAEQCFVALDDPQAESFTIMGRGKPVAMFGATPVTGMNVEPGVGIIWMLACNDIKRLDQDMQGQVHEWMDWLQRYLPVCYNYVSVDNDIALRWCKSVGFDIGKPEVYGNNGEEFCQIIRKTI